MASSRMFEGYCVDIEGLLREGSLRRALRLALALPDICAALEDTGTRSSADRYVAWCASWLQWQPPPGSKAMDARRLFKVHASRKLAGGPPNSSHTERALGLLRRRRSARAAQALSRGRLWFPAGKLQAFELSLSEALVSAARRWYRDFGSRSSVVQRNLSLLTVKR